ncbi:MAG TPA: type II secretion system F family protein [Fimbriimonadaceae bacterium]|nr:type II secretion system F family protein [Fimbriimonadaceae bacterium]
MTAYKYKGYDARGLAVSGEVTANSIEEVEHKLASSEVTVISIVPLLLKEKGKTESSGAKKRSAGTGLNMQLGGKKVKIDEIAAVLRNMAVMAETGVPLIEALNAVTAGTTNPRMVAGLRTLKAEVVGGKSLAAAMKSATGLFPNIVCDMVRVAEDGGRLDKALNSAAGYLERSIELRKKIVNAMMYPMVLSCVAVAAVVFLVTWILPSFAKTFSKMGAKLPTTTRLLLDSGTFVRTHPIPVVAVVLAIVVGVRYAFKSPHARRRTYVFLHKIPVLGELLTRIAISRTLQTIGTLLSGNVPIIQALEHGARVAGDPLIEEAYLDARGRVEHGANLSDSLGTSRLFPQTLIQMIAVGERTGRLPSLMNSSATHMETEVDSRLKALISIIEPLMIVFMAVIVGMITASIILPIYSLMESIK